MKSVINPEYGNIKNVAPFAGAWIEIRDFAKRYRNHRVAPFAGAWIEILDKVSNLVSLMVAPFAGAWIEIIAWALGGEKYRRRSLRGSVD